MRSCPRVGWGFDRRLVPAAAFALALPLLAADASAQDCGSWSRPVVCEASLVAQGTDGRAGRIGDRTRYRMAPRDRVDLLLDARDQRGRRFPLDRVTLSYDDARCRGLVDVEPRQGGLRLTARAGAGRCPLLVWLPGNLNFEWEVEVEIDPAARTSYSRRQAEFLAAALYRAVLDREPDAAGAAAATSEIQLGNLEGQIDAMVRSSEFRNGRNGVPAEALLDRFYLGLFGRRADTAGTRSYLGDVRAGRYAGVLLALVRSAEFERRLPD